MKDKKYKKENLIQYNVGIGNSICPKCHQPNLASSPHRAINIKTGKIVFMCEGKNEVHKSRKGN